MNTKLSDLNNILFAELEALQSDGMFENEDGSLKREAVELACMRADKVCDVSGKIIELQRIQLDAVKTAHDMGLYVKMPDVLGIEEIPIGQ